MIIDTINIFEQYTNWTDFTYVIMMSDKTTLVTVNWW